MDSYQKSIMELVRAAIEEDVGKGDLTSLACLEPNNVTARIIAKSEGVLSGMEPVLATFELVDSANVMTFNVKDGEKFAVGDTIAEIDGFNQTVLTSERVALNFLAHLSGIATVAARFVARVGDSSARILDTRKTTPGWRYLEKQAVLHGGGSNHRFGLYDMVLIKDNHIASAGSITGAVSMTREYLDTPDFRLQFEIKADDIQIEVEITSEDQLREAIEAGVDRLLLDNQSLDSLSRLVATARELNPDIELEASGNVTLDTVADIAATGVNYISIGAITHSAPVSDFSLQIVE